MKNKKLTLKDLPQVNNPLRRILAAQLPRQEFYVEDEENGWPCFSELDLVVLEMKYRGQGMTMDEMLQELRAHGWEIEEKTLRYYIKTKQIPGVQRRERSSQVIVHYYPANAIRHFNFTKYCLFASGDTAAKLITFFKSVTLTDQDILVDKSVKINPNKADDGCVAAMTFKVIMLSEAIRWTNESVWAAFKNNPAKLRQYLKITDRLSNAFIQMREEFNTLNRTLKDNATTVSCCHPARSN